MYSILIKDYENKKSLITEPVAHYSSSLDACEDLAFKFILSREGERYFVPFFTKGVSLYKEKTAIKKRYTISRKEDCLGLKLTIFHKEQNGFILSGELKKIIQFQTLKVRPRPHPLRDSMMTENWRECFDEVVRMLKVCDE
jgi:hypothetical protein